MISTETLRAFLGNVNVAWIQTQLQKLVKDSVNRFLKFMQSPTEILFLEHAVALIISEVSSIHKLNISKIRSYQKTRNVLSVFFK